MINKIELKGWDTLANKLSKFDAQTAVNRAIIELASLVQREAKIKAPVLSGKLKNSIQKKAIPYGQKVYVGEHYGAYKEFGTGISVSIPSGWESIAWQFKGRNTPVPGMKAKPYFIPAVNKAKEEADRVLQKHFNKLI